MTEAEAFQFLSKCERLWPDAQPNSLQDLE